MHISLHHSIYACIHAKGSKMNHTFFYSVPSERCAIFLEYTVNVAIFCTPTPERIVFGCALLSYSDLQNTNQMFFSANSKKAPDSCRLLSTTARRFSSQSLLFDGAHMITLIESNLFPPFSYTSKKGYIPDNLNYERKKNAIETALSGNNGLSVIILHKNKKMRKAEFL